MSVYVVALTMPDLYLSPGDPVPDGAGAWVESFANEGDAWQWILSPSRSRYYAGEDEAALVVADSRGRVLS